MTAVIAPSLRDILWNDLQLAKADRKRRDSPTTREAEARAYAAFDALHEVGALRDQ